MPKSSKYDWEALTSSTLTLAMAMPEGFTTTELSNHLGTSYRVARRAMSRLKFALAKTDTMNIVGVPQSKGEEWRFTLKAQHDEESRDYTGFHLGYVETRLRGAITVFDSYIRHADPDSAEVRAYRALRRDLIRSLEDITEARDANNSNAGPAAA